MQTMKIVRPQLKHFIAIVGGFFAAGAVERFFVRHLGARPVSGVGMVFMAACFLIAVIVFESWLACRIEPRNNKGE